MWTSLIPVVGPILTKVLDRIIPGDSEEARMRKLEIEAEIIKELSAQNVAQLRINEAEAMSDNIFKSGWRPAVAWLGVFGLFYTVFGPIVDYTLQLYGLPPLPNFDAHELTAMLMGLLGLGGYRTYEKYKGLTK